MPRHALELVPDEAGRRWVRRDWEALRAVGLPSQADHRGPSNVPHVTFVSAAALPPAVEDVAVQQLAPLMPLHVSVGGLLVLGEGRVVLARHVELDDATLRAYLAVRAVLGRPLPGPVRRGWTPHLTLARRLPAEQVGRALEVLSPVGTGPLVLDVLRRWDPDRRTVRELLTPDGHHGAGA